jgi:hypothetical protein
MRTQPAGDGGRFPIGEDLHRAMRLQVDQQGAVAVAFFPGEIVESEHLWGLVLGNSRAADEPKERITARGHRQALRQLRAGFAPVSKRDLREGLGLSQGPPGVGAHKPREAFCKGGTRAAPGAAHEAAHLQAHTYCSSMARQISQRARVATSNAGR